MLAVLRKLYPSYTSALHLGNSSDQAQLHGNGYRASQFATVLEDAMVCGFLKRHTLVPIGLAIAGNGQGVLSPNRKWCVDCTLEQLRDGRESQFYPLLWTVRGIEICLKHMKRLSATCHSCGRTQRFLPHQTRLDVCDRCAASLIENSLAEACPPTELEIWMAHQVRSVFISDQYGIANYDSACVARFLSEVCVINGIPKKHLAERLGLQAHTVIQWAKGRYKPSLDLLLHLLYNAQVPLNLLLNHPEAAARQTSIPRQKPAQASVEKRRKDTSWVKRDHEEVRRIFKSTLKEHPDLTLPEVAEIIGVPRGSVYYIAGDIYREHLQQARNDQAISQINPENRLVNT